MTVQRFKTVPKDHQLKGLLLAAGREGYGYLCDMGTGKTWMGINEAAQLWGEGKIDTLFVVAPKGVHLAWVIDQIPTHMPDWVRWRAHAWTTNNSKRAQKKLDAIMMSDGGDLRIFTMNWDALVTERGYEAAKLFCESKVKGLFIAADESQRMKNMQATRTKRMFKLKPFSNYRRILSGSPILTSPFDAFSQFTWLDKDIFGTDSFFTFKTEYAELMQPGNRLFDHIVGNKVKMKKETREACDKKLADLSLILRENGRQELIDIFDQARESFDAMALEDFLAQSAQLRASFGDGGGEKKRQAVRLIVAVQTEVSTQIRKKAKALGDPRRLPKIVAKGKDGEPKYKNMEKLSAIIGLHSYRVLKSDCLDLPEKTYKKTFVELGPKQRAAYKKMKEEARIVLADATETPVNKLASITKLAQICSNFVKLPMGDNVRLDDANPKLDTLEESIEDSLEAGNKIIVWARFRLEAADIVELCKKRGWTYCLYNGDTSSDERVAHIAAFQRGEIDVFIGQQKAGGTGTTLTRANHVIYYSNTYALEDRVQSEDRAHRIGQTGTVVYEDILVHNSIEEKILKVLMSKKSLAASIIDVSFLEQSDDE